MASGLVPARVSAPRVVRPGLVIAAATIASANVFMNVAAINALLPALGRGLSASETQLQWIGDVYPLVLAALLLPAGTLVDRYGRRRGMLAGLVVMFVAQIASAVSDGSGQLIAARAITGAAAALVFPATLATISSSLPPDRKDRAVSIWAIGVTIGGGLGMVVAVALLEISTWRWTFVLIAGCTLFCIVLSAAAVPESRQPVPGRLDVVGSVLAALSIGAVVAAVNEGPVAGWSAPLTVTGFVAGLLAGVAFVRWELRVDHPLLDLSVFADRNLSGAAITLMVMFAVDFGMFFLVFQERSFVDGDSALKTALLICGGFGGLFPGVVIGPWLAARRGLRPAMTAAMLVCSGGMAILASVGAHTGVGVLMLGFCVFWGGVAIAMTPATRAILDALPAESQGVASAVNDVVRELGVAIGVAAIGSAFTVAYRHHVSAVASTVPPDVGSAIRRSPATALAALESGPPSAVRAVQDSVVAGWHTGLLFGVGLLLLATLGAWILIPARSSAPLPELSMVSAPAPPLTADVPALRAPSRRLQAYGVGAVLLVVGGVALFAFVYLPCHRRK